MNSSYLGQGAIACAKAQKYEKPRRTWNYLCDKLRGFGQWKVLTVSDAACIWKHNDLAALMGDWGGGPATGGQIQVNDEEGLSWDSGQDTDRCKAEEETWHLLTECCLGV